MVETYSVDSLESLPLPSAVGPPYRALLLSILSSSQLSLPLPLRHPIEALTAYVRLSPIFGWTAAQEPLMLIPTTKLLVNRSLYVFVEGI